MSENTLFSLDDTGVKEIQATYTPEANKTIIGKLRVAAFPNYKLVEITWENYSNLTEEEKNSETIYFITDKEIIGFKGVLYADDYNKIDNTPIYLDENNEVVINENYQAFFDFLINKDIEGNTNEIIVSDGEGWAKGQDIVINKDNKNSDKNYIEYRIGVSETNDKTRICLTNNPEGYFADDDNDRAYWFTISDNAKMAMSDNSKIYMHHNSRINMDQGPNYNFSNIYTIQYYYIVTELPEVLPSPYEVYLYLYTNTSCYDSDYFYSNLTENDLKDMGYELFEMSNTLSDQYDSTSYIIYVKVTYKSSPFKNYSTISPQMYLHGNCQFMMSDGKMDLERINMCYARQTLIFSEEQETPPNISDFENCNTEIYRYRRSTKPMSNALEELLEDGYIIVDGYPPCYYGDKKTWYLDKLLVGPIYNYTENGSYPSCIFNMSDNSIFYMSESGYFNQKGNSKVYIEGDNSILKIDNNAQVFLEKGYLGLNSSNGEHSPTLTIQDGCQFIMNGNVNYPGSYDLDSAIITGPDSFLFVGQCSKGSSFDSNSGTEGHKPHPRSIIMPSSSPSDLVPSNRNPRIKIADETAIFIDGNQGTGSTYIKISSNNGGQVQLHLTDNIFQQMSGNAHSEMHDDSKLIMRGNYKQAPWYDYVTGTEESRRPVQQGDNGPIVGLYDNPVVMIRGTWEDVEYITSIKTSYYFINITNSTNYNTLQTEFSALTSEQQTLSNFTESSQNLLKNLISTYFLNQYQLTIKEEDIIDCVIDGFFTSPNRFRFKNLEYISERKPENWSPHLEEKENNPYIEIIESSKVKLSGHAKVELTENFSISTDENGFNFSDGTSSVSFTLAELQNLKALLSN